ncbi:unnamed protein product [Acanthosepion pharaonis]|uniref:Uncharacterized protein n=1 Tax=Acanthosepion pharaonis TaxID=158019 RepID=A0A812AMM9_ACAPH|nr:unnamed protein product [Sepia pharaonis]
MQEPLSLSFFYFIFSLFTSSFLPLYIALSFFPTPILPFFYFSIFPTSFFFPFCLSLSLSLIPPTLFLAPLSFLYLFSYTSLFSLYCSFSFPTPTSFLLFLYFLVPFSLSLSLSLLFLLTFYYLPFRFCYFCHSPYVSRYSLTTLSLFLSLLPFFYCLPSFLTIYPPKLFFVSPTSALIVSFIPLSLFLIYPPFSYFYSSLFLFSSSFLTLLLTSLFPVSRTPLLQRLFLYSPFFLFSSPPFVLSSPLFLFFAFFFY